MLIPLLMNESFRTSGYALSLMSQTNKVLRSAQKERSQVLKCIKSCTKLGIKPPKSCTKLRIKSHNIFLRLDYYWHDIILVIKSSTLVINKKEIEQNLFLVYSTVLVIL